MHFLKKYIKKNIPKMTPVFKISVLENEDDPMGNAHFSIIQPRLPTFDSFKQAIFDRMPALKKRPLYMFYIGKQNQCVFMQILSFEFFVEIFNVFQLFNSTDKNNKVVLNSKPDFDHFKEKWSTTFKKLPNLYVSIVLNPKKMIYRLSNDTEEPSNDLSAISSTTKLKELSNATNELKTLVLDMQRNTEELEKATKLIATKIEFLLKIDF